MPLAPGDRIAGYTVIRELGNGGMGAVYLVRHPRLPRSVALKLLRPEFAAHPDFAARFLHEADMAARLTHRNIVDVLDRGEDAGQLWLTMQYIDGIDVETALAQAGGLFSAQRAVHIIGEVAAALDYAHKNQVVHRDVKPANILLAPGADDGDPESVYLTDFGIAKALDRSTRLTRSGVVMATFDYASPEQIESAPLLDARSDIYSLSCVFYRLLTGRVPFPGATLAAAIHGHLTRPPPRPTDLVPWVPSAVDAVVARAMAKDPADRYPNCRALAETAAVAVADFPDPPRPPYRLALAYGAESNRADVGPLDTDRLPTEEVSRVVDLVRRTRFFDLPENLADVATQYDAPALVPRPRHTVTIQIDSTRATRRVVADLDSPRRPPDLHDLVTTIDRLAAALAAAPAPPTVIHASAPRAPKAPPTTITPPAATDTGTGTGTAEAVHTPAPFATPSPPATTSIIDTRHPTELRKHARSRRAQVTRLIIAGVVLSLTTAVLILILDRGSVILDREPTQPEPLTGHTSLVNSVAFSPDGTVLASGSDDDTIRLWNLATRQPLGEPLTGHTGSVTSVAFSPGGTVLASGSYDPTIRLWNLATRQPLGEPLTGHTGSVTSVALSPDGTILASGSDDDTIRLWNPATRQPLGEPLTGHTGSVTSVAFSPDGTILASGSDDDTIRLWEVPSRGE